MKRALPSRPPSLVGSWTLTLSFIQICDLPAPNSPTNSVMACVSSPFPSNLSRLVDAKLSLWSCFRRSGEYCSGHRLGIFDISHRKKALRWNIGLLVTGEARILLNLSRHGLPHHVDPRVANPRRCTRDRRSLDSDFDSDRGEDRYGTRYSAQPCDIHRSHIHRSPQLWIRGLSIESDPDSHYPQHEATLTVQQSDSLERWACIC